MSDESEDSGGEAKESKPDEPSTRSVWEPFAGTDHSPDPTDPNAHSEEEAFIDRGEDVPADEPDAETDVDEDEDDEDDDDAAAKRAALEAEIDRQLATLESVLVDEDEPEPDDELEDALEGLRTGGAPVVEPDADEDEGDVDEDVPDDGEEESDTVVEAEPDADDGEPADEQDDEAAALAALAGGTVFATPPSRPRRWMPLAAVAVVAAIVIGVLVATGGDDEPSEDPSEGTSTTVPITVPGGDVALPAADALEYFEAYGTQDPDELARMLTLAAPGSSAHAYAVHQETLAGIDPQRNAPLDIALEGDAIEACPEDDEDAECITYADFTATPDGLLTHFTINGSPLRDRVSVGTGSEVTAGPMTISIISSYLSVSDRLFVAYIVRNDGDRADLRHRCALPHDGGGARRPGQRHVPGPGRARHVRHRRSSVPDNRARRHARHRRRLRRPVRRLPSRHHRPVGRSSRRCR